MGEFFVGVFLVKVFLVGVPLVGDFLDAFHFIDLSLEGDAFLFSRSKIICVHWYMDGSSGGGFWVATQSHSIKYSTTDVLGHAEPLICIAKCLVVLVVRF